MRKMIMLPGIGGSGATHWQTAWERGDTHFTRFTPASWGQPELGDWMQALERAIRDCEQPPVLVAHSLSCLLVAHWASEFPSEIAGAFLVCVPDPNSQKFPSAAASFRAVPANALRFPSLIVASANDPYGTMDYVRRRSLEWQAGLVVAGALGHINASSGLGDWPRGRALLEAFCAGLPKTARNKCSIPSSGSIEPNSLSFPVAAELIPCSVRTNSLLSRTGNYPADD